MLVRIKFLTGTMLVGMTAVSACDVPNTGGSGGDEALPDEFTTFYVCTDSAATTRVLQGQRDLRAALNAGIDDCAVEYNAYVDFTTAEAFLMNGVRPQDGDPSVRRQLAADIRESTIENFLPIYRRATQ